MDSSPNLTLPYIQPAQAQKHVSLNQSIRMLDTLVQLSVLDRTRSEPPAAPQEGDRHIVGTSSTGLWDGRDNQIAAYQDGVWSYFVPAEGWQAWIAEEAMLHVFHSGDWQPIGADMQNLPMAGINATADATNRLALASDAALFSHEGAGHQLKINKAQSTDTASVLFQTGWEGCAEMGIAGSDDFAFKVSPDGNGWHEAIVIDRHSGAVSLPVTTGTGTVSINTLSSAILPIAPAMGRYITLEGYGGEDYLIEGFGDACPVGWTITLIIPRTIGDTGGPGAITYSSFTPLRGRGLTTKRSSRWTA